MEHPLCVSATLIGPKKITVEKNGVKTVKGQINEGKIMTHK